MPAGMLAAKYLSAQQLVNIMSLLPRLEAYEMLGIPPLLIGVPRLVLSSCYSTRREPVRYKLMRWLFLPHIILTNKQKSLAGDA